MRTLTFPGLFVLGVVTLLVSAPLIYARLTAANGIDTGGVTFGFVSGQQTTHWTIAAVPEPAAAMLLACGAAGLLGFRRRRQERSNATRQSRKVLLPMLLAVASTSEAAVQLNEIFLNPPNTDNSQEFIELRSTLDGVESLAGLTLLNLEGDATGGGTIEFALDLSPFSTGTNGLFLWRDNVAVISPAPAPATVVNVADWPFIGDLENGSQTFLIVAGYTGTQAQDLDPNDDGTLDIFPWTSVIDAIGFLENDPGVNRAYGLSLGFVNFGPGAAFNADVLFRDGTDRSWQGTDVAGTNPGGPYTADPTPGRSGFGATGMELLTPGNVNVTVVPEPSGLVLLAASSLGLLMRRRI